MIWLMHVSLILKNSDQMKFPINISSGEELTIKKLANMIKKVTDFKGNILWDKTKPDGVIRKRLNIKKLKKKLGGIQKLIFQRLK